MAAYLTYMTQRIIEMHRVLKDTGSLYLHCDQTASHYLKILLDEIFGKNNFRNEIVWSYQGTAEPIKHFKRKHDIILFYVKSKKSFFSNAGSSEAVSDFSKSKYTKKDEMGYYKEIKHRDGQVHKQYLRQLQRCRDVWEIPIINAMSKERTGYPTQKPLELLKRIILASSNEGDIVFDPFCGCATTCVAAQQLNRKWIGIDIEKQAVSVLIDRLSDDAKMFKDFINITTIPQRTDIEKVLPSATIKERLYKEQNGKCNGCGFEYLIKDFEIDHIIPKSKGGGSYYENYQLLCGNCNRKKGNNTMEYLLIKAKTRKEMMKKKIIFGK
jgi:site-specific DNA-methyltransferase (adenine-specific)